MATNEFFVALKNAMNQNGRIRILVGAHRGGHGECGIENTNSAFKYSATLKRVSILELDVQITKDKKVVICHDNNLKRLTGHDIEISSCNFDELPRFKENLAKLNDKFKFSVKDMEFLLLEDFLKDYKNSLLSIEPKQNDRYLVSETIRILKKYKMIDKTILGSHIHETNQLIAKELPNVPLFMSVSEVILLTFGYYSGLSNLLFPLSRLRANPPVFMVPNPRQCSKWFIRFFLNNFIFRRGFIEHVRNLGIPMGLFDIDDRQDLEFAEQLGFHFVITDYPKRICQCLEEDEQNTENEDKDN